MSRPPSPLAPTITAATPLATPTVTAATTVAIPIAVPLAASTFIGKLAAICSFRGRHTLAHFDS
jgi:uncharacterized membrane protein (DUF485 family)